MPDTQLGLGIIGCGGAAASLCRAADAIPALKLIAGHDANEANAVALTRPRGGRVLPSVEALLAEPGVDIVYVALPHFLLAGVAEQALVAGKHVLVEKPLALDVGTALRLGRLASEKRLTLGVFFELREAETVRVGRRLIAGGAIGDVRSARIETLIDKPLSYWSAGPGGGSDWRAHKAEAGGGVALMNSIHQIDSFRRVTGLEIVRVTGAIATLTAGVEVEDFASCVMELSNGGRATLLANAHSVGARIAERITIEGTLGAVALPDPFSGEPVRAYLRRAWEDFSAGEWIDVPTVPRDSYPAMLGAFVAAVQNGTEPPATAADAAAALGVVLALYESARSGCAVAMD